jgi:hypothetical protein
MYLGAESDRPERGRVNSAVALINILCNKGCLNTTGMAGDMEPSLGHEISNSLVGIVLLVAQFWVAVDLEREVTQVLVSLVDGLEQTLSGVQLHPSFFGYVLN